MIFKMQSRIYKKHKDVKDWWFFKLSDCPVVLWKDRLGLVGIPNSHILRIDSIVRKNPHCSYYEGYTVWSKDDEFLGVVVYDNGFYMQKSCNHEKKEIPRRHIYMKVADESSIQLLKTFTNRTPISFKYEDTIFSFNDIVTKVSEDILMLSNGTKIDTKHVTDLVMRVDGNSYYYGDYVDGKMVCFEKGKPILK